MGPMSPIHCALVLAVPLGLPSERLALEIRPVMSERASSGSQPRPRGIFARVPLLVWVLACAGLWGSAFPVIKLVFGHWQAVGQEIDFATRSLFAGVRFATAGACLLALAKQPLVEFRRTPWRWIAALALTQTIGQYVCFYLGLSLASGALAALLVSTGSFWWVLLAPLLLKTSRTTKLQWLVLAVGAAGVSLAVYAPGVTSGNPRIGAVLILLANLFGALGIIVFQFVRKTMGARAGTGFSLFLGGVVFLILGWPAWTEAGVLFDGYVLKLTAWLAFVSAAAFSLWNHLSGLYPVQLLATFRFLIPVAGVVESLILLEGERLSWGMLIGGTLVIVAMILAPRVQMSGGVGMRRR